MENKNIQEQVADAIIETEEIRDLKMAIQEKEDEILENEEWEMDEVEFDDELDSIYPEVEIAGHKYSTSNALKNTDECLYDQIKMEMEDDLREDKDDELKCDLEDLKDKLESLIEDLNEGEEEE